MGRTRRFSWSKDYGDDNENYVNHVFLYVISLPSLCTIATWKCLRKTQISDDEFFFPFLNMVLKESTPGKFAYIWHFRRSGIKLTKFKKRHWFIFKVTFSLPSKIQRRTRRRRERRSWKWICVLSGLCRDDSYPPTYFTCRRTLLKLTLRDHIQVQKEK